MELIYVRNNPLNMVDPTGETSNPGQQFIDTLWQLYDAGATNIGNDIKSEVKSYQEAAEALPVTGDASNIYGAITGETLFTGQKLSLVGRGVALGMLTPIGRISGGLRAIKHASTVAKPAIEKITNTKLVNFVKENYKDASIIGNKSTADAIRHTKQYGELVGGSDHLIKGQSTVNGLQNLLRNGNLNAFDRQVARSILNDTKNALSGK